MLDNPSFVYYNSTESNKPGYLQRRMVIYKEMVQREQDRAIHSQSKDIRIIKGDHGSFYDQQNHSEQSPKLVAVREKG